MKYAGTYKTYKLKDARANLSKIIDDVNYASGYYLITKRNKPKAVIMDYEKAKKLLGNKNLDNSEDNDIYDNLMELLKKHKSKSRKIENISGNVDKIVYGN